jgi:hypothetical protein
MARYSKAHSLVEPPTAAGRVMQAMLGMKKLDIQGLRAAYEGR